MPLPVPARLAASCAAAPERLAWLERLPGFVAELRDRWSLVLDAPFDSDEVSAAWVAPATLADGTGAVLKLGMPHFEAEHELDGLRFWDGDATVRVLDADEALGAMLLERCSPGTHLRALPEEEQDLVIAGLLRRLWRAPPEPSPFRPLAALGAAWAAEADPRAPFLHEGTWLLDELPRTAPAHVVLATDLHAGNVLRSEREPWLAIDPKPFAGDPAYDATQHLLNCEERLLAAPLATVRSFADLLEVDYERVRLWTFARAAVSGSPLAVALAP